MVPGVGLSAYTRPLPVRVASRFLAALAVLLVLRPGPASAHPAPFSYLDLRLAPSGVSGTLTVHDLDAASGEKKKS